MELKEEKFDVVAEVRKVMHEMEASVKERGLTWELQVDNGEEVWAMADRQRTQQVLFNLLGNALKYTDAGGVYVKVGYGGMGVKVDVYDTGRGIENEEQGVLFNKFRQVGDRIYTRDASQGTGMGLYITRLIVEAMGPAVLKLLDRLD